MPRRRFVAKNKRKTVSRLLLVLLGAAVLVGTAVGLVLALSSNKVTGSMTELPFTAGTTQLFTGNGFL